MSKKRRSLVQNCRSEREAYLKNAGLCEVCGVIAPRDVHEIARGPARSKSVKLRSCWLAVCRPCHEALGDYRAWPIAKQLALKLVRDPEFFDLAEVNHTRGRAANAIELKDLAAYLEIANPS